MSRPKSRGPSAQSQIQKSNVTKLQHEGLQHDLGRCLCCSRVAKDEPDGDDEAVVVGKREREREWVGGWVGGWVGEREREKFREETSCVPADPTSPPPQPTPPHSTPLTSRPPQRTKRWALERSAGRTCLSQSDRSRARPGRLSRCARRALAGETCFPR